MNNRGLNLRVGFPSHYDQHPIPLTERWENKRVAKISKIFKLSITNPRASFCLLVCGIFSTLHTDDPISNNQHQPGNLTHSSTQRGCWLWLPPNFQTLAFISGAQCATTVALTSATVAKQSRASGGLIKWALPMRPRKCLTARAFLGRMNSWVKKKLEDKPNKQCESEKSLVLLFVVLYFLCTSLSTHIMITGNGWLLSWQFSGKTWKNRRRLSPYQRDSWVQNLKGKQTSNGWEKNGFFFALIETG